MATIVPRNEAEANVLTYRSMEQSIKDVLRRYANKTANSMFGRIRQILNAAGYDGTNRTTVLIKAADPATIRALEELANSLPLKQRKAMLSKLYGQIGSGSLTVRKAIRDVTQFGVYENGIDLYDNSMRGMREIAKEGMLRGEFSVQRGVGIAWRMQSPSIGRVDAFLKGKWTQNDVTAYLQPLSKIVQKEVEQSLFLGESPAKMAQRMRKVEDINIVRSERNARTITTAVSNQAHMDSYKRHGVKRYEYVATFDERTCPVCGALDGRTFPLSDKSPGRNFPPMHPNCRCTTVAALSKALKQELYSDFEVHGKDGIVRRIDARETFEDWKRRNVY